MTLNKGIRMKVLLCDTINPLPRLSLPNDMVFIVIRPVPFKSVVGGGGGRNGR